MMPGLPMPTITTTALWLLTALALQLAAVAGAAHTIGVAARVLADQRHQPGAVASAPPPRT